MMMWKVNVKIIIFKFKNNKIRPRTFKIETKVHEIIRKANILIKMQLY